MNKYENSDNMQAVMLRAFEAFLADKITPHSQYSQQLHEAMKYSLASGGKRLRPLICMGMAYAISGDFSKSLSAAAAIECIHTYSLIHDDLPCMDDDDFRRGRPTLHKAFNEWLALLAGDALLTSAFEIASSDESLTAEQKVKTVAAIAVAAGANGMVAGQVADMQGDAAGDETKLAYIHGNKTGQLLKAAALCGAISANADSVQLAAAGQYGDAFGMAFQITDDIIDAVSTLEEAGKCTGKDADAGKTTYVTLYGVEKAQAKARLYIEEAVTALIPFGDRADFLKETVQSLIDRKR